MLDAMLRTIQSTIRDAIRIDPKLIENLRTISESASKYGLFMTHLANRGWGVPAHSLAARNFNIALDEADFDFVRAEERVADYYETIALPMAGTAAAQPALSHLKTAIEDAGNAHKESHFALAVPIWLISIDATVDALRGRSASQKAKAFSTVAEARYLRVFDTLFQGDGHELRGLLGTTLSRMGRHETFAERLAPTVNRAAALHGKRCYSGRNDSLRALTVLFALIDEGIHDEGSH